MSQETIEGLLKRLDEVIARRERDYQRIDSEYKREDGTINRSNTLWSSSV